MDAVPAFCNDGHDRTIGRTSQVLCVVDILQTCKGCDTLSLQQMTDEGQIDIKLQHLMTQGQW